MSAFKKKSDQDRCVAFASTRAGDVAHKSCIVSSRQDRTTIKAGIGGELGSITVRVVGKINGFLEGYDARGGAPRPPRRCPEAVPAFSGPRGGASIFLKGDERRPGSPAIGLIVVECDGQGSRVIVKSVPFEQARTKIAEAERHIQR